MPDDIPRLQPERLYERFAPWIKQLPEVPLYQAEQLQVDDLCLYRDARIEMYYAPTDYLNTKARLVILGITPGWRQMEIFVRTARERLLSGSEAEEVLREARLAAAFAGSMRTNLIGMLDGIGVARALGVDGCASLFAGDADKVHMVSALRYPVFRQGKNYTGHGPSITAHPLFRHLLGDLLAADLQHMPSALIVPLGKAVEQALDWLVERGDLQEERILRGFPHPSGANGHRHKQYAERQAGLQARVEAWFSEKCTAGIC